MYGRPIGPEPRPGTWLYWIEPAFDRFGPVFAVRCWPHPIVWITPEHFLKCTPAEVKGIARDIYVHALGRKCLVA